MLGHWYIGMVVLSNICMYACLLLIIIICVMHVGKNIWKHMKRYYVDNFMQWICLCEFRFQVFLFITSSYKMSPWVAQISHLVYTNGWLEYHTWYRNIHIWLAAVPRHYTYNGDSDIKPNIDTNSDWRETTPIH